MKKLPGTEELDHLFRSQGNLPDMLSENKCAITNPTPIQYLNEMLAASGKEIKNIAKEAELSASFVYQIFEGSRRPGRDVLIRLAFVVGLTVEQTQRTLRLLQRGELYPRIRREAIIIHSLANGKTLTETDELLRFHNETPLMLPSR